VSDSPLYPLDSLQVMASRSNPELRVMRAMGEAASTELELSRKDYLPDFDLSLQYGQRSGSMEGPEGAMMPRSDMVTAMVSFPIPLQKTRKQNAVVKSSQSALSAIQAETRAAQNRLAAEIARTYSDISHQRTLLALTSKTFLPQARATIASATNSYQSGTGDLNSVLVAQATLLEVELTYHRALSDFASKVADLEALVGQEVLR